MKVIVTGASGMFGADIARVFAENHEVFALKGRKDLDLTNLSALETYIKDVSPDLVIHVAGMRDIDPAEKDPAAAYLINTYVPKSIAMITGNMDIPLVHISTDAVFEGMDERENTEFSPTNPINVYGHSKLMAEKMVRVHNKKHFIIRVPLLFGCYGEDYANTFKILVDKIKKGTRIEYATDCGGMSVYTEDVAKALLQMVETTYYGTYIIANTGKATRYEFYMKAIEYLGLDKTNVFGVENKKTLGRRQKSSYLNPIAFNATFGIQMRPYEEALKEACQRFKELYL